GSHAAPASSKNAAPSGLNSDVAAAAAKASHGSRRRTNSTVASAQVTEHANGARPMTRSPTTKTATPTRDSTHAPLLDRPASRPNRTDERTHASAIVGTVPSTAPTTGASTL